MVVYPRWRGELFCALAFCWLSRGLSPLARGTLCRCQHCWRVIRFIPAGAGNTVPRIISLSSSTVYPRWRGEHSASLMPIIGLGGLSPLARGTRRQRIVRLPLHRFIPAGAGNTSAENRSIAPTSVYPRWRGEHDKSLTKNNSTPGLSPLARGTHHYFGKSVIKNRFIPAGAGNTYRSNGRNTEFSVYPRWRGEHKIHIDKHRVCIGLSPLARGTLYYNRWTRYGARFIPAGAGNTNMGSAVNEIKTVYPRWRGEHEAISKTPAIAAGLSPLARGTPGVERQMTEKERFIPAGAGNTSPLLTPGKSAAVYPRWRGEHLRLNSEQAIGVGLSPLARGTRTKYPSLNPRRRFIPADAGNTDK
ncbi:Domain of uncharacterised function (DUF2825) [Escherichia coli]|nr:Domain of uncharacterised function (DUF2825) [Escherichia coli]